MAKTLRDANLETRAARARLKVATKPYYRAIDEGLHLGYRRNKVGGKWVMRTYAERADKAGVWAYQLETIASTDDTVDADGAEFLTFGQAQALARARFVQNRRVAAGLPVKSGPYTVQACLGEYLDWMKTERKSANDSRKRAEALIYPTLGAVECAKLTTKQLRDWRDRIAATPARLRTKKGTAQRFRAADETADPAEQLRRRRASTNRVIAILKAALNRAWRDQKIGSDGAWRALAPFEQADAARNRYLTVAEAKRLINASQGQFSRLVRAALLTGCRFGELSALNAGDFHFDSGTLLIRTSKSGRPRDVILTAEGQRFFGEIAAGRKARDAMLPKDAGGRWLTSTQTRPMADACAAAQIEPAISFHILRHTYASLAIMGGAPLKVVADNLGHVDTRMVEKHYGHLSASFRADAIRAAVPEFVAEGAKVVAIGGVG